MKHEELKWKSSDGLDIYGQYWAPDGTPEAVICLVHGMGEHSSRYAHVADFFINKNIALISYDHRGHGKSGGKRGHTPSYDLLLDGVTDLINKANEIFPGAPQFLYGHSMGGNVVVNYAIRKKPSVKGIILSGPYLRLAFNPPAFKVALGKFAASIFPGLQQPTGLDATAISQDKAVVDAYINDPLVHDKISAGFFVNVHGAGEWAMEHASELELPTLIFHGTADRLTSHKASEEFARSINGHATLKLWEGLYHETHNEAEKQQVFEHIYGWIEQHLK